MSAPFPQIRLGSGNIEKITAFLETELRAASEANQAHLAELRIDDDMYDGVPKPKTFPWPGAANVRIPIGRITSDALAARYVNTLEAPEPRLWAVRDQTGLGLEEAKGFESFMEAVALEETEMDMHRVNVEALFPMARRGYATLKVNYVHETRRNVFYDRDQTPVDFEETVFDTVRPEAIPAEDILLPADARTLETARWKAHILRRTEADIRSRESSGRWNSDTFKSVKGHPAASATSESHREDTARQGIDSDSVPSGSYWTFHEVWFPWVIKGRTVPIVVVYHLPTKTIARIVYRWYWHGFDPFIRVNHFPASHPYPPGAMRRTRGLSRAIDTAINQQIDNATLANTRFWKGKLGEPAFRKGLRIWPGRLLVLSDLNNLVSEQMGEVYPASERLIDILLKFVERDTGIADFNLGQDSALKSAVPATSTIAFLQEGMKRIDFTVRDFRSKYGLMGKMALSNFHQFSPVGKAVRLLGQEKGQAVERLFQLPRGGLMQAISVQLAASSATLNEDIARQNNVAIMQMSTTYYQNVIQLGQMLSALQQSGASDLAGALGKIIDRGGELFERTLDSFKVPDASKFSVKADDIFGSLQGIQPPSTPAGGVAANVSNVGGLRGVPDGIGL